MSKWLYLAKFVTNRFFITRVRNYEKMYRYKKVNPKYRKRRKKIEIYFFRLKYNINRN